MSFKTIKNDQNSLVIIKKSKFYISINKVNTKKEVSMLLKKYQDEYSDATHICYAYIIGPQSNYMKAQDDVEPNGTAGLPILNMIKTKALTNVIIFVIRYFGGIKLGAGGLIRAYTQCAKEIIELCEIINLQKYFYYKVTYKLKDTKFASQILASIDYEKLSENYDSNSVVLEIRSLIKIDIYTSHIQFVFVKNDY